MSVQRHFSLTREHPMLHRSSVVCDNTGLCYQYKINKPTRRKPMNRPLFGKSCQARCQGWTKLSSIICLAHGLRLGRIDMYNAHDVWSQSVTALSISVRSAPPVRISVRLYFIMSERLIDATSILHYELEAPPV
jgi:hypothetical protein